MRRAHITLTVGLCLVGLVIHAPASSAEPPKHDLAGFVPQDTLVYVGSSGSAATAEAFSKTALGAIAAEPEVRRFLDALENKLPPFVSKMAEKTNDPGMQMLSRVGIPFVRAFLKHPCAVILHGVEVTEQGPAVRAALLIRAGEQAPELAGLLDQLAKQLRPAGVANVTVAGRELHTISGPPMIAPLVWGVVDDALLLTAGAGTAEKLITSLTGEGEHLSDHEEFKATRRKMNVTPAELGGSFFVNLPELIVQGRALALGVMGKEQLPPMVEGILREAGLAEIRSVAAASSYHGGGMLMQCYAHVPGVRKGLLALSPATALTGGDLRVVPEDAKWMVACNLDLGAAYQELLNTLARVDPGLKPAFKNLMLVAEGFLDIFVEDDLLTPLGDTWVAYDAPSSGGLFITGITIVVDVDDPEKIDKTVRHVIRRMTRRFQEERIDVRSMTHRVHKVSFVNFTGLPVPVAPAWGWTKGRLVIAAQPQMVTAALDRMDGVRRAQRSILDKPDFKRVRKMCPKDVRSLSYVSAVDGYRSVYAFFLLGGQTLIHLGQGAGLDMDASVLPSWGAFAPHLFGTASAGAVDEDGVMWTRFGALPASSPAFEIGPGNTASTAMLVSILLPSLSRARELSKRTVSAAHLSGIGQACMIYMNDHEERMPPGLQTLVEEGLLTEQYLHSPRDNLPGISYIVLPGAAINGDGRVIVAYERSGLNVLNECEGTNVLFGDGHVEFVRIERFLPQIRRSYEDLGRAEECPF